MSTNFNIQNIKSSYSSVSNTSSTQKVSDTKQEFSVSPSNRELLQSMNKNQIDVLYMEVAKASTRIMNNMQQNVLMRDMFGLPKEWANLLNEFAINNNNEQLANILKNLTTTTRTPVQSSLLELLMANSKINLLALAEHLNLRSAFMADRLLKHMGAANLTQNGISQLKNMMTIGASIANSANINPNGFLRDIMQMYLPWLPLTPPKEEDLSEIEGKFREEGSKDAQASFYLATNYLGYFKVEIILSDENEIYITNVSEKEIGEIKESLCQTLNDSIKKTSIKAKLFYTKKIDKEDFNLKEKQLFVINSTDSMIGLTLMQLISRVIFEFDEKQGARFVKANEQNTAE